MASPIFIAVNQTAYDIELVDLRLTVPASGQVTLSAFNPTWRIQSDAQLLAALDAGTILLNDGTNLLTKPQSIQYLTPVAASVPIAQAATADTAGYMSATDKAYLDELRNRGQLIDVSIGGAVTSVKAACDSITDASATKPYLIRVFAGVYTEAPFTIPAYVTVVGLGGWLSVVLKTSDNAAHFITGNAGAELRGVCVEGPTGVGYAAIDYVGTGYTPFMLYHVVIRKGYFGLYVHPATYGTVHAHEVVNQYAGSAVNTFFRVTNGNLTAITCSWMSGPSGSVTTGFYTSGSGASMTLDNCAFMGTGSTDAVFADDGAHVRLTATTLSAGTTALRIGTTGTGTDVLAHAVVIGAAFTNDIIVGSASATLEFNGAAHRGKITIATGAIFGASFTDDSVDSLGNVVIGELWLGSEGSSVPLGAYIHGTAATGEVTGSGCSIGTGLHIEVAAGSGFISSLTSVVHIEWAATTIDITASLERGWIIVDVDGLVQESTVRPNPDNTISLCSFVSGASSIVALSGYTNALSQLAPHLAVYTRDVIGPINVSGGVVSQHADPGLELTVTDSTFYVYFTRFVSVGADPITFTYWYRSASTGWTKVTGCTAIDTANYDDGSGTLAPVGTGKFTRDVLYVTANAGGQEYHVVYGQELFDSAVLATVNPTPPDYLLQVSCRLAAIVTGKDATDITRIDDQRPKLGQLASASTSITKHGDLTGLGSDDHCFSADTELLTTDGWISYSQIERHQTMALSFNKTTERLEPSMVLGKYVYDNFTELQRFSGRGTEILVTPQHKMVYRTADPKRKPGWRWQETTAEKLATMSTAVTLPMAGVGSDVEYPRPDDYLKLLAWVVSEGNALDPKKTGYGFRVYQAEGNKADRIEGILSRLGLGGPIGLQDNRGRKVGTSKYETTVRMKVFYVPSSYSRDTLRVDLEDSKIPKRHLLALSSRQFRLFLGELVLGDGSVRGFGANASNKVEKIDAWVATGETTCSMAYASKNESLIDWLQEACARNGLRTKKGATKKGQWYLNIVNFRTQGGLSADIVPYAGNVWCVSVMKNQTLVLRRKGRVFVAGNTQYQLRTERNQALGYAGLDATTKIDVSAMPLHHASHESAGADAVDHNSLTNYSANRHTDHTAVSISTSNGLQGGGDLSATRTLSPSYGSSANTVCQGNDARLSDDRTASAIRSATTVVSVSAAAAPTIGQVLRAVDGTSATWQTFVSGANEEVQFNDAGVLGADAHLKFDKTNRSLVVGTATATPDALINLGNTVDSYIQISLTNLSDGTAASADLAIGNDLSSDVAYYVDLGINGSMYADPNWSIMGPSDAYLYSNDSNMLIGSAATGKAVKFFTDGSQAANLRATIDANGFSVPTGSGIKIGSVSVVLTDDSRLTDARTPSAHSTSHKNGGSDEVATATATANSIPKTGASTTLAIGWLPTGSSSSTVCIGNDSRLSDARTPTSHATSHNAGGGDALAIDAVAGTGSLRTLGTAATSACAGNDSRLSDARTPSAHSTSHKNGGTDEVATATATANSIPKTGAATTLAIGWIPTGSSSSTVCIGNDSRLSDARTPTAHATTHNSGGADAMAIDAVAGTGSLRTLGTAATSACAGNDSRLTDARTPTSHASTHNSGGGDAMAIDAVAGTGSLRTLGTAATSACAGNDSRLTNARTPTAHAATHQNGGGDEVATATAAANSIPKTGATTTLAIGWIPTGSSSSTVCIGNDSRLSDARTPTSHATSHNAGGGDALAIDAVAGTGSLRTLGTAATAACAGNDSRLSDDRTASGIRTATNVVSVSAATAPTTGQILKATSATTATWQTVSGSGPATDLQTATTVVSISTAAAPTAGQVLKATSSTAATWQTVSGSGPATDLQSATTTVNVSSAAAPTNGQVLQATSGTAAIWATLAATTLPAAMARKTATFSITSAYTDVSFDETTVETNSAIVDHLAGTPDRIQVYADGTYLVSSTIEAAAQAAAGTCWTRVVKNDSATAISGSEIIRAVGGADGENLSQQFIVTLAANDWLSVQVRQNNSSIGATGATFMVVKLEGPQGAKGDTGSGSTITLQSGGLGVANTPHSTLNLAQGLEASDAGAGVGLLKLTAFPPIGDTTTKPGVTPTAGTTLFAKFRAGRHMTAQLGPSGLDYGFQPALFANKISYLGAGNGTTISTINSGSSASGTATTRNVAITSFFTQIRRVGYVSATAAGSSAGVRHNLAQFYAGNAAGRGGWFMVARFGVSATQTNYRFFVGMSATAAAFGNADPSTLFNQVGVGCDGTDASIYFMHNDGSGACTKTILTGWAKPSTNTEFYELRIFIAPFTTKYYWSLENLGTGAIIEGGTGVSTDIPPATTFLSPQVWINNNAIAAAVAIDVSSIYVETDN
jgi:hypothetical protein